ncbi:MAG: hypothetical protein CUN55_03935 [Phototrophicales bacterium]|nr:MAG: hypothetical protein CUN55_03935 [Phototrophicales bacterium]
MVTIKQSEAHFSTKLTSSVPTLLAEDVSIRYGENIALRDVNFMIWPAERVAVIGPNGAGKSTLFKGIVGILPLYTGRILLEGRNQRRHSYISYVPQHEMVDWRFPVNVWDVVMMGRSRHIGYMLPARRRDKDIVTDALHKVGMWELRHRQIGQLSGGQRRRVFIARALAQEARLLLMDEPFAGVDASTESEIFEVLEALREHQVTVVIATHDLDQAATRYDKVLMLNKRQIAFGAPKEVYTVSNMQQTFGGYRHVFNFTG